MRIIKQRAKACWDIFVSAQPLKKCRIISLGCLCLFFVDCSITGAGRYITIGPFTPRMILALLAALAVFPILLKNLKQYLRDPLFTMFILFAGYLCVSAVRGYLANNRMNVLISDLKGFMWLFLVPVMIATIDSRKKLDIVLSCILTGAIIQAIFVLVVNFASTFLAKGFAFFYQPLIDLQIGFVSIVSSNVFRIFMKSGPYMAFACAIAFYKQVSTKKTMYHCMVAIAVCLNALLLSFTRSVYGCVFVVIVCAIFALVAVYRSSLKRNIKFLAKTLAATLIVLFALEYAFGASYFNFAASRTFGIEPRTSIAVSFRNQLKMASKNAIDSKNNVDNYKDDEVIEEPEMQMREELQLQQEYLHITEESDGIRAQTQSELKQLISKNPVFGNGLGASAPCREDGLDEYFYLDVLARMGIVGLILYVLPFVYILFVCYHNRRKLSTFPGGVAVICGLMGFWAITWFNPWMNAVLGIAVYALCCTIPGILKSERGSD